MFCRAARVISKHIEEKKVIRSNQHGLNKRLLSLTNMIAFCDGVTTWVDEFDSVSTTSS